MSIVSKGKLIVAAIASRPYVAAAVRAGYEVVAIDAFADVDVSQLATDCYQIALCEGQLDHAQLLTVLNEIDSKHGLKQFVGFCYGAGFEQSPNTLLDIGNCVMVLGNSAAAVHSCKSPDTFFERCERLQLPFPAVMNTYPPDAEKWIEKVVGGSGGEHIQWVTGKQVSQAENTYYQQFQPGVAVSCLFIASERDVEMIGFSEQWLDASDEAPFRYGGAVGHVELSARAKARFSQYVLQLSKAMNLVGVNSCDAICHGDDVYLLEVNPRLSATMDLYTDQRLIEKHVAACQKNAYANVVKSQSVGRISKAHQVVYAEQSLILNEEIAWPEWVCDVPAKGSHFSAGMPVCTVVAEGESASIAKMTVNKRAQAIKRNFLNE